MINTMSENISNLRKDKGITQEELGRMVGVSTQAVSKWENGGMPDTVLLPIIADSLGVSIDTLFGRISASANLDEAIMKYISDLPEAEKFCCAFELCLAITYGINNSVEMAGKCKLECFSSEMAKVYVQALENHGVILAKVNTDSQYFFLMPEPKGGYKEGLCNAEDCVKLFEMLAQRDIYDTIIFINSRENNPFTTKIIEKQLNISTERVEEILKQLLNCELISERTLELDDEIIRIYNLRDNPAILPFLAFANEIIKKPSNFFNTSFSRTKPYF